VFCTINEDFIWCYCFYQKPNNFASRSYKTFKISTADLTLLEEGKIVEDIFKEVLLQDERAKSAVDPNDMENINFHIFRLN
jgi:hypothetical protein